MHGNAMATATPDAARSNLEEHLAWAEKVCNATASFVIVTITSEWPASCPSAGSQECARAVPQLARHQCLPREPRGQEAAVRNVLTLIYVCVVCW